MTNLLSGGRLPQAFPHMRHEPSDAVVVLPLTDIALPLDVGLQQLEGLVAVRAVFDTCSIGRSKKQTELRRFSHSLLGKRIQSQARATFGNRYQLCHATTIWKPLPRRMHKWLPAGNSYGEEQNSGFPHTHGFCALLSSPLLSSLTLGKKSDRNRSMIKDEQV